MAQAQYNLALYLKEGEGVPVDPEASAIWMAKAAQQGKSPLLINVTYPNSARHICKGIPEAQFNLGVSMLKGDGVPRNKTRAVEIFRCELTHW